MLLILFVVWIPSVSTQSFPEERRILFHSVSSDSISSADIYTVFSNGAEIVPITEVGVAYYPTWSSDGSSILFVEDNEENDTIVLLSLEDNTRVEIISSDETRLMDGNAKGLSYPVMTSDMAFIAFVVTNQDSSRGTDIFLLDMQLDVLSRLTNDRATEIHPQFSPDSSHILFLSDIGDEDEFFTYSIHIIDLPSQARVVIPNNFPSDPVSPRWMSNDTIIFASNLENWGLYVVNMSNLETGLFYSGELLDFNIIEGFDIAIETEQIALSGCDSSPTTCEIYIVDIQEDKILKITDNEQLDSFPSWQPFQDDED